MLRAAKAVDVPKVMMPKGQGQKSQIFSAFYLWNE
jgi:hypothetical protein